MPELEDTLQSRVNRLSYPSPLPTASRVVISHPTGNEFVRAAAVGLWEATELQSFFTTVASYPGGIWDRLSFLPGANEFERRSYPTVLQDIIHQSPFHELVRVVAGKLGWSSLTRHEHGPFCVDAVYRRLDRKVAKSLNRNPAAAVYAYEDGALESFRVAKTRDTHCMYDLPIGYWKRARELLQSEWQRWPEWANTLTGFRDSAAKLQRKDEELRLADKIFVASSFTRKTLASFPGELAPIEVIPYGFPDPGPTRNYDEAHGRPLKLLFVGGLSQRKGIADVVSVAEQIGDAVELTIVGRRCGDACPALESALSKHQWTESMPHQEIIALMRKHDVLLFPSLFEGFGMVITEAMSQGTPVITTDRTAGPDVITDGVDGWIIPAGDTNALHSAVVNLLNDPDQIAFVGENARQTAMRRPWSAYGTELASSVTKMLAARA